MIKTAEAVSPAHPDKVADQISDLILTEALQQDPNSRVAVEVLGGHGVVHIIGEMTTRADVNIDQCVKKVLKDNRYENFDEYEITSKVVMQSHYIAEGVKKGGAGDQGIMIGYACRDNPQRIPRELYLARKILKRLWENPECRDAKSQVTIGGDKVTDVVVSAEGMNAPAISPVIAEVIGDLTAVNIFINPAGPWENGGFEADTGLTGRKIAYDNYGPQVEIGGGCFSGKDPTKVDRSGAYMARALAVRLLKMHSEVNEVRVKVAYAIGIPDPVMVSVQLDDSQPFDRTDLYRHEFRPEHIIKKLGLKTINYYEVAKWGSFGNNFSWEQ